MNEDTKFILEITGLVLVFMFLSAIIRTVFPIQNPNVQEILGSGYIAYSMLVTLNLFILSLVPFRIGMRFQIYLINRDLDVIR